MSQQELYITERLSIPPSELRVQFSTSGGPGGQHANKTSTKATLRWNIRESQVLHPAQLMRLQQSLGHRLTQGGELIIHNSESRSQSWNAEAARERLVELVRQALIIPKKRKKTKPTQASVERRLQSKRRQSERKAERRKSPMD